MGKKSGNKEAKRARQDEEERQRKIRDGTQRINGLFDSQFNDDYFRGQRDNYSAYATPQLDQQYGDANKQLTYSLARAGLLDSSVRGEKAGELQRLYDLNKQKVGDDALSYETQSRNAVEDARGNLISTLNVTGDAEAAANSALNRAQALAQPAAYSPLVQMFSAFTDGIGTVAAREKAEAYGGRAGASSSASLFNRNKGAVVNR